MTPLDAGQRERVKILLDGALSCPPEQRDAFLAKAPDDSLVLDEVRSLLEDGDGGAAVDELRRAIHQQIRQRPPWILDAEQRVGPYRILRELGQGGMGTVYLAQREDDFHQEVALKLLRPGWMPDAALERFANERQILAHLDHPCIVRIVDAGSTREGLPYFVMNRVDGEPIDAYCKHHDLDLETRLELLAEVADTVHAAHQSLVVHRDLKPSNILVTVDGTPRLLDFGIAKRLDSNESSALTGTGITPMTHHYACPEQLRGRPTTTAADIYALGILLYELLTDGHPFATGDHDPASLTHAICNQDPPLPSRVTGDRRLAGDLDSIVLRSLAKAPEHRYASARELAEDLRRHLGGRPVSARDATPLELVRHFARRYHHQVMAAAAVLLLTLVSAGATALQWRRAELADQRAAAESQRQQLVVEIMGELIGAAPRLARDPRGAFELAQQSQTKIPQLAAEPSLQAEILQAAATIFNGMGLSERALLLRQDAARKLAEHEPGDSLPQARALNNLAISYLETGRSDEALTTFQEALAMKRRLGEVADLAKGMSNLASTFMQRGELTRAESLHREALTLREDAFATRPETTEALSLAHSLRQLGNVLYQQERHAEAEPVLRRALELRRQHAAPVGDLAAAHSSLGRVLRALGRWPDAARELDAALVIRSRDGRPLLIAITQVDLGALALDRGKLERAEALLVPALATLNKIAPERLEVAIAESLLGGLRTAQGRHKEAEPLLRHGLLRAIELRGEDTIHAHEARARLEAWERADPTAANPAGAPASKPPSGPAQRPLTQADRGSGSSSSSRGSDIEAPGVDAMMRGSGSSSSSRGSLSSPSPTTEASGTVTASRTTVTSVRRS